ncbi:MAG: hypothetical protein AAF985_21970 [Bacteroidota bacterium]
MKKLIKETFIQMIPVMIGVYLGFALNNFGAQQKLEKQTEVFQQMLHNEIEQNLKEVSKKYTYHQKLQQDFQQLLNSQELEKDFGEYNFTGFLTGKMNASAYNTGIQTGIIQEFDLQLVQHLNRLYTLQEAYTNFNRSVINNYMGKAFPETEKDIRALIISVGRSMNDILSFERDLSAFYTKILQSIK